MAMLSMRLKVFALALILTLTSIAKTYATDNAVRVTADGQEPLVLKLDQRPVMTFEGDEMLLATADVQVRLSLESHPVITFIDTESDGIEAIQQDTQHISIDRQSITLQGFRPDAMVSLYTVDGKLVAAVRTDSQGNAKLPITTGQTYLLRADRHSFKLMTSSH